MTSYYGHWSYRLKAVERTMQASVFKAQCLAVLDEVAETNKAVVITKHGKAVARLVPIESNRNPTLGSVTLLAEDDEAYFSVVESWDADG